ncbi:MAG: C1 family peptidase [Bacteroidota bacterium]
MLTSLHLFFQRFAIHLFLLISLISNSQAQTTENQDYNFTLIKEIKTTSVKNQFQSGTCWSFATTSFLESELLRLGKNDTAVSEMYFVRNAYISKAISYVRLHGNTEFGEGGQAHDVMDVIKQKGFVPREVYLGLLPGKTKPDNEELDGELKSFLEKLIKNDQLSSIWLKAFTAILDTYLGKEPDSFIYKGKNYTPKSFSEESGIHPEDYIEITSFIHHPFYSFCRLEVADNWSYNSNYLNLPLDDLIPLIKNSIENGYTVAWDGDVSEREFMNKKLIAIVPAKRWEDKNKEEKENTGVKIEPEMNITPELRQQAFDNYSTTDDHLMHIVGMVKDTQGNIYFKTKNSWGCESNSLGGFIYISENYVRLKTIALLLNKKAVPQNILKKAGL